MTSDACNAFLLALEDGDFLKMLKSHKDICKTTCLPECRRTSSKWFLVQRGSSAPFPLRGQSCLCVLEVSDIPYCFLLE